MTYHKLKYKTRGKTSIRTHFRTVVPKLWYVDQ